MKRPVYLLFEVSRYGVKHLVAIYTNEKDAEKQKEKIESIKVVNIGHAVCKIEKWFFAEE